MSAAPVSYMGLHTVPHVLRIPVSRLKGQHTRYTLTRDERARWERERETETRRWVEFLRGGPAQ